MTSQVKSLVGACLRGKRSAWNSFVQQYSGLVYYTIKKTLSLYHVEPRTDIVDDLFQNFFVSVIRDDFRKLRQFTSERGSSLASWLRVVISRQTIDFLRRRKVSTSSATEIHCHNHADPSASIMEQEQERLLSQIVEALAPRDRLFVNLYFYQNLSPEEIAKILGVSTSAVYTKKSRILTRLRESLNNAEAL